jgi:NmrA-like family
MCFCSWFFLKFDGHTSTTRPCNKTMTRIVVVFGATGTQGMSGLFIHFSKIKIPSLSGSSVVDALLADKTFTPRAVTRNASSEAAKKLASRGVQVVTADLWDKVSITDALAGCEGVFGVRI